MPFLTFFSKCLKNKGFEYLRGPGAFGEKRENFVFFNFFEGNVDFSD